MIGKVFQRSADGHAGENTLKAALDIGTSKVTCFIADVEKLAGVTEAEIVGVGHQASVGVGVGGLLELPADQVIRAAVDKAERMAGARVKSVNVAISGRHLACRRIGVDLQIGGHAVVEEDLATCFREGARLAAAEGLVPLHMWPAAFRLDGVGGVHDPRGLACDVLSVEIVSLAATRTAIRNITGALERCHLRASQFIAAPYASALATLHEEERKLGVLSLDIGARLTGFSVFKGGNLLFAGAVPVGSTHITQDIVAATGVSLDAAERAKNIYGTAFCAPGDDLRHIELEHVGDEPPVNMSVTQLAEIIGPRLEEIVRLVLIQINDAGLSSLGLRRAVITGGGSQLQGTRELLERLFGLTTRIGRPLNMFGAPEAVSGSAFAVSAGMIDHYCSPASETSWKVPNLITPQLPALADGEEAPVMPGTYVNPFARAANWLRVNF